MPDLVESKSGGTENYSDDWLEEGLHSGLADERASDSTQSIRSFWLGVAGLACAAAVATPIVEFLFLMVNKGLWKLAPQDPNTWQKWMSSESYRFIFTASGALGYSLQLLIGSFVWISIAPIASWRGSLSRRFVISVGMALGIYCVLTGVDFHLSTRSLYARIPVVVAQGLCWLSLPYIMVLPIFREKRGLRMITGGGIILLSASVSFASVSSVHTFQWRMMELGIGLCICQIFGLWVCVLRRQAMVEAGMSDSSIARTTSLTLLELTTIVGLMVAVLSPLLMGVHRWSGLWFWNTLLGAICMQIAGLSLAYSLLPRSGSNRPNLLLLLLIGSMASAILGFGGIVGSYRNIGLPTVQWWWTVFLGLGIAQFILLSCYAKLCIAWIRWCGWRLVG